MKFLGIDFGLKKIGLAYSEGSFAQPLKVITFKNQKSAIEEIKNLVKKEGIEKIIVGIPDEKIANNLDAFVTNLEKETGIKIETEEETASTYNAQNQLLKLGVQRKKRKKKKDAVAAALILENYLSENA